METSAGPQSVGGLGCGRTVAASQRRRVRLLAAGNQAVDLRPQGSPRRLDRDYPEAGLQIFHNDKELGAVDPAKVDLKGRTSIAIWGDQSGGCAQNIWVSSGHSGIDTPTGVARSRGNNWGPYEHIPPAQWGAGQNTSDAYHRCCTAVGWVAQALALRLRLMHAEKECLTR